ncbi:MAG: ATP-binding cassette domain-containing protein [Pseudohongiellaceae bacterium]|nr:ATP-binding cassette domain-containing protein [Pseudohongiellaceae bacterium]
MSDFLEIEELCRYFDINAKQRVHAVDHVSLSIAKGETLGLVGESGSGKSTLGKTLLGLHDKSHGQVMLEQQALPTRYKASDFRRLARKMQMIFQDPYSSLNPRMTVGEIIAEPLLLNGLAKKAQAQQQAVKWLERVGLHAEHMSRYPHEFSGGQRQRIGIARALILQPDFVVCDEPISALDVSVQAQIVNLLNELKQSLGLTMMFIAHDLSMVRYISDRMAVMYLGAIVEIGASDEVFFNPKHPYTQILVASNPEPDPASERERVATSIQGEIPSPINVPEGCRFAARCPQASEVCMQTTPTLKPAEGRLIACHLY